VFIHLNFIGMERIVDHDTTSEHWQCPILPLNYIRICLVDDSGIKPLYVNPYEGSAYSVSQSSMVQPVGIEPTSTVLQTVAMTTSAKVALFWCEW
jgi:hypothetical protein